MTKLLPKPRLFPTTAAFNTWLERTHASEAELVAFEADKMASAYWDAQTPSYRRMVAHWLVSAKKTGNASEAVGDLDRPFAKRQADSAVRLFKKRH